MRINKELPATCGRRTCQTVRCIINCKSMYGEDGEVYSDKALDTEAKTVLKCQKPKYSK
jgi:hypothetical protein